MANAPRDKVYKYYIKNNAPVLLINRFICIFFVINFSAVVIFLFHSGSSERTANLSYKIVGFTSPKSLGANDRNGNSKKLSWLSIFAESDDTPKFMKIDKKETFLR